AVHVAAEDPLGIFSIDASGTLGLNTTDTTKLGLDGHSFLLDVSGHIELLKVLKLDAGFAIHVNDTALHPEKPAWDLSAHASVDFFGLATLSGSIFLDSDGNFDVQISGQMWLGTTSFGLLRTFNLPA